MRIAIDGRALTGRYTGDRTYWRGLVNALPSPRADMEFIVYSRTPISPGELPDEAKIKTRVVHAANDRLWTLFALPAALREDGIDLLHVQYTTPPRPLCPCPVVTTVHDISFKIFPEWFARKDRILLNLTVPASMRRAARVITDSESSKRDILKAYCLPPEQVIAIPLGLPDGFGLLPSPGASNSEDVLARYGIVQPFVLAVGVLQPRKNLPMLCRAFGIAKRKYGLPHTLAIAGKAGWQTEHDTLIESARQGGGDAAAEAVRLTGYVEDTDLPTLYRAADLFAYPSLYEGFGLPPIEAMACGTPVLVSDAPALPEVVGDAARIAPVNDPEAWAAALNEMLTDPLERRRYSEAGPRRAACFTWEETAQRTREVYRDAVS